MTQSLANLAPAPAPSKVSLSTLPTLLLSLRPASGTTRWLRVRPDNLAIISEELGYVTYPTLDQLKSLLTIEFPEGAPQVLTSLLGLFNSLPPWPQGESLAALPSSHDS